MKTIKKAAMFGLDARIALAIFGALSVISGAALYSAIKQAKVIALVNQMHEISKAYEAFYLDTGTHLTKSGNSLTSTGLFSSNLNGWNGPYLSLEENDPYFKYYDGDNHFVVWETDEWGSGSPSADIECDAGEECSIWLSAYYIDRELAEGVDSYIDGNSDHDNGNVRLFGTGAKPHIWLKVMPWPNN